LEESEGERSRVRKSSRLPTSLLHMPGWEEGKKKDVSSINYGFEVELSTQGGKRERFHIVTRFEPRPAEGMTANWNWHSQLLWFLLERREAARKCEESLDPKTWNRSLERVRIKSRRLKGRTSEDLLGGPWQVGKGRNLLRGVVTRGNLRGTARLEGSLHLPTPWTFGLGEKTPGYTHRDRAGKANFVGWGK